MFKQQMHFTIPGKEANDEIWHPPNITKIDQAVKYWLISLSLRKAVDCCLAWMGTIYDSHYFIFHWNQVVISYLFPHPTSETNEM